MELLEELKKGLSNVGESTKEFAGKAWDALQTPEAQAISPADILSYNIRQTYKEANKVLTPELTGQIMQVASPLMRRTPSYFQQRAQGDLLQSLLKTPNPERFNPDFISNHVKGLSKIPDWMNDSFPSKINYKDPAVFGEGTFGTYFHNSKNPIADVGINPAIPFSIIGSKRLAVSLAEAGKVIPHELNHVAAFASKDAVKNSPLSDSWDLIADVRGTGKVLDNLKPDSKYYLDNFSGENITPYDVQPRELAARYFAAHLTNGEKDIPGLYKKSMQFAMDSLDNAYPSLAKAGRVSGDKIRSLALPLLLGGAAGAGVLGSAEEGNTAPVKINNLWRGSDSVSNIVTSDNIARAMYNLAERPVYRTIDNPMGANQFGAIFPVELNMANLFDVRQDPDKVFDIARIAQERFGRDPKKTIKEMSTGNWDAYESGEGNRRGRLGDIQSILKGEGYSGNYQVEPTKFQLNDINELRPFVKRRYQDVFATFARPELSIGEKWKDRNELVPLFDEAKKSMLPVEEGGQGLSLEEARKNVSSLIDPNVLYNNESMQFFHPNWKPLLQEYRPDAYQLTDAYENKHMFPPESQGYVSNRTITIRPFTPTSTIPKEDFYSPGTINTIDPSNQSELDKLLTNKLKETGYSEEEATNIITKKKAGEEINFSADTLLNTTSKNFAYKKQAPYFNGDNENEVLHYHMQTDLSSGGINNDFNNNMAKTALSGNFPDGYTASKKDFKKFLQWEKEKVTGVDNETLSLIHNVTSNISSLFKEKIGEKEYNKILGEFTGFEDDLSNKNISSLEEYKPIIAPWNTTLHGEVPKWYKALGTTALAAGGGIAYDESQDTKTDAGLIGKFKGVPKLKDSELISQVENTPEYKILNAANLLPSNIPKLISPRNVQVMSDFDRTEEAKNFFNPAGRGLSEVVPERGIGDVASEKGYQAVSPVKPIREAVKVAENERNAFLGNAKIDVKNAFDVSTERDRLTQDAVDLVNHPIEYLKKYSGGVKKNLPELIKYEDKNPVERMKDLSKTGINLAGELAGNLQERGSKLGVTGIKLVKNVIKGDASVDDVKDAAKALVGVASFAGGPLGHLANIADILSDKETSTLGNVALGISSAALAVPIIRKLNQSGVLFPLKGVDKSKDSIQKALEFKK